MRRQAKNKLSCTNNVEKERTDIWKRT